jgi:hypothetical protein
MNLVGIVTAAKQSAKHLERRCQHLDDFVALLLRLLDVPASAPESSSTIASDHLRAGSWKHSTSQSPRSVKTKRLELQ